LSKYTLTLNSLRCVETEDWFGSDEVEIRMVVDGRPQRYLTRSMTDGDVWPLAKTFDFDREVVVEVWDADSPDADDLLGKHVLHGNSAPGVRVFNLDGADYRLSFKVVTHPPVAPPTGGVIRVKKPWEILLDDFEADAPTGKWKRIKLADLISDMRATLSDPMEVDQEGLPYCGAAALVFELVRRNPAFYVKICRELWEKGSLTTLTGATIRASAGLLASRPSSRISLADWLLMATLLDDEGYTITADNADSGVRGMTWPWELARWTRELLGLTATYIPTLAWGEFEAMRKADAAVVAGGVAFLNVSADMMRAQSSGFNGVAIPDHWVVLDSGVTIDDGVWYRHDSGHIKFDAVTWGTKRAVDLGEGPFEDWMWGVVIGQ
jgi:hypothetical protein